MSPTRKSPRRDSHHVYDFSTDETPSEAVVFAVADATDRDPLTMDPLNETIETASLDRLLGSSFESDGFPRVTFEYYGLHITVAPNEIQLG